jgi:2-polyprenyl-3-methyl-5-hydroxy-6-metoxy-1,4-benzoquinol methylase
MTKQAERDYARVVDSEHLYRRPFDCPRVLQEFGVVLELFLKRIRPGGSILDLGCGPGWTSLFLAKAGYDVVGVDIAERMIEIACERSEREGTPATFLVADMEELQLDRQDFDGVLLFDSLHHSPAFEKVLERACAHLRPGGRLLLMEPSWLHLYSPHARAATREYGVTELGFTRRRLKQALRHAGFGTVTHYYDAGVAYRGLLGFLRANLRLWCSYLFAYPQAKQIVLARK